MEPIVCFVLVANTIVIGLSLDTCRPDHARAKAKQRWGLTCFGVPKDVEPDWRGWQLVDAVFLFLYIVEIGTKLYVLGAHDFVHGLQELSEPPRKGSTWQSLQLSFLGFQCFAPAHVVS
eukprot:6463713-Amphidinium_carterae.1